MAKLSKPAENQKTKISWSHKNQTWLVLLLALIVRIIYLISSRGDPSAFQPLVDSRTYHQLAESLSQSGEFNEHFLWQSTFYPLFLALAYKIVGVSLWAVKIVQVILGSITCYMTIRLGERAFSWKVGLSAGLIVALYGPLVFFDVQILATGWATFWLVALALLALNLESRPGNVKLFLLGNVGGLAILTRPTFVPIVLFLFVWVIWQNFRSGRKRITFFTKLGFPLLGLFLILGPYAGMVHSRTDHLGIIPPSGGINLFIGNNPEFDKTIIIRPGLAWDELIDEPTSRGYAPNPWSAQPYFMGKVMDFARNSPGAFGRLLGQKTLQLISTRELPRNLDIYLNRSWSPILKVLVFKLGSWGFPFGVLLPFAGVGLAFGWRRIPTSFLIIFLLYGAALVLVFVSSRYKAPLIPFLAILGSFGFFLVVDMFGKKDWKRLCGAVLVGAMVTVMGTVPGPFAQEAVDLEAEVYFGVGWNHYDKKKWPEAEKYLRLAVEKDPELAVARNFLGITLVNLEEYDEAVEHFGAAVRIQPDYTEAKNNLDLCQIKRANHHYRRGRTLEGTDPVKAMDIYRFIQSFSPKWPEVLVRIAWLNSTSRVDSLRNGENALALVYSDPVEPGRTDPYVMYVEAAALAETGEWEKAISVIQMALDICSSTGRTDLVGKLTNALSSFERGEPLRF